VSALGHFFDIAFGRRGEQAYELVEAKCRCPESRLHIPCRSNFYFSFDFGPVRPPYFVVETHFFTSVVAGPPDLARFTG